MISFDIVLFLLPSGQITVLAQSDRNFSHDFQLATMRTTVEHDGTTIFFSQAEFRHDLAPAAAGRQASLK
jgi:hypothetical protein